MGPFSSVHVNGNLQKNCINHRGIEVLLPLCGKTHSLNDFHELLYSSLKGLCLWTKDGELVAGPMDFMALGYCSLDDLGVC